MRRADGGEAWTRSACSPCGRRLQVDRPEAPAGRPGSGGRAPRRGGRGRRRADRMPRHDAASRSRADAVGPWGRGGELGEARRSSRTVELWIVGRAVERRRRRRRVGTARGDRVPLMAGRAVPPPQRCRPASAASRTPSVAGGPRTASPARLGGAIHRPEFRGRPSAVRAFVHDAPGADRTSTRSATARKIHKSSRSKGRPVSAAKPSRPAREQLLVRGFVRKARALATTALTSMTDHRLAVAPRSVERVPGAA